MANNKVVHCKKATFDVYIGRPSKWGNPFNLSKKWDSKEDETKEREASLNDYRIWINEQPELMKALPSLKGKTLGCWCAPKLCHGDVLAELAEKA